ncbi:hypothetical protein G3I44_12430 [Halogeometricum borinquense]|uniref:Uncharacterized protein n=1 Tax=Halogeometricum borinquense TaxID=60847 RepID=A0A6C0UHI5_9EURY|nr:hypothetical protein [Halogeometricum borinquense]QIB75014.1 hypothetical protein G3I44_12430 [Halogeometricum borinquense]
MSEVLRLILEQEFDCPVVECDFHGDRRELNGHIHGLKSNDGPHLVAAARYGDWIIPTLAQIRKVAQAIRTENNATDL